MIKKFLFGFIFIFLFLKEVSAHCPLCTIGAAAAAGGAVWLGVSKIVVALFIGGFAMSMALWFSKLIKKEYIPYQKILIAIAVFLLTLLPILPFISDEHSVFPFYLSLYGDYGSLLNRTYLISHSLISSLSGALLVFVSPAISKSITKLRKGKKIPFQGVLLTLLFLLIIGGILQFVI